LVQAFTICKRTIRKRSGDRLANLLPKSRRVGQRAKYQQDLQETLGVLVPHRV
jgi:hypothetical protein